MKFAIYGEREIRTRYFNGVGYVVRHQMYPHTDFSRVPRTLQGHSLYVGARRGDDLTVKRYTRPDTTPRYEG